MSLYKYHHMNLKLFNFGQCQWHSVVLDSFADFMKNSATNKVLATNSE